MLDKAFSNQRHNYNWVVTPRDRLPQSCPAGSANRSHCLANAHVSYNADLRSVLIADAAYGMWSRCALDEKRVTGPGISWMWQADATALDMSVLCKEIRSFPSD